MSPFLCLVCFILMIKLYQKDEDITLFFAYFLEFEPCSDCSKNIIASGIKRIVYDKAYEHTNSDIVTKFIKDNGVIIEQID